jgi:hypothetical protein
MASAADMGLRARPGTAGLARFTHHDDALAWLDAEQVTLTAAVTLAADGGEDELALNLSLRLAEYFSRRRKPDDRLATAQADLQAARRLGSPPGEADPLNNFGLAMQNLRQPNEAITAHQAAELSRCLGNVSSHAPRMGGTRSPRHLDLVRQPRRRSARATRDREG